MIPWLNKRMLAEEPGIFLALLYCRTEYTPQAWFAHDLEQTEMAWLGLLFSVRWSPKCVVITPDRFGELRD